MYARKKKGTSKKVYLAITLLVILVVSVAAVVYYTGATSARPVNVGVHIGDTFTYSIKGSASLQSIDAVVPEEFYQYNQTDFFRVTVVDINGSHVILNNMWRFLNGTEVNETQDIDLSDGSKTNDYGFWSVYSANLNIGDYLRPNGKDYVKVNNTDTYTYADSVRQRNYFKVENEFRDMRDPTGNTLRFDSIAVYFDRETGMLQSLINYQLYNNPQYTLVITWTLMESSVWQVK